jgi:transcriptional regulator with XRE-family HTH domain
MLFPFHWPKTPRQIRAALSDRHLSQQALARLSGVNPRTVRHWCDARLGDERRLAPGSIAVIGITLDQFDASQKSGGSDEPASFPPPPVPPL